MDTDRDTQVMIGIVLLILRVIELKMATEDCKFQKPISRFTCYKWNSIRALGDEMFNDLSLVMCVTKNYM